MSLLISSFRSRILQRTSDGCTTVGAGAGGGEARRRRPGGGGRALHATYRPLKRPPLLPQGPPVLPQARVLDFHDLAADVPQDLLPPLVCLVEVIALAGEVGPGRLFATGLLGFAAEPPVEHGLRLLLIARHLVLGMPGIVCCQQKLKGSGLGAQVEPALEVFDHLSSLGALHPRSPSVPWRCP